MSDWKNVQYKDGKLRTISSSGGSGHTYSTTEQVVGTWIDGKPIYELTMNPYINGTIQNGYTYSNGELTNSPFKNANPESIIDYRLILKRSTDYVDVINAAKSDILRTDTLVIVPNLNGNIWLPPTQYEESTKTVYIIIQYTKTTD